MGERPIRCVVGGEGVGVVRGMWIARKVALDRWDTPVGRIDGMVRERR